MVLADGTIVLIGSQRPAELARVILESIGLESIGARVSGAGLKRSHAAQLTPWRSMCGYVLPRRL